MHGNKPSERDSLCKPDNEMKKRQMLLSNGRDERIRTSDPSVPNAMLYQTEPRPDPITEENAEKPDSISPRFP